MAKQTKRTVRTEKAKALRGEERSSNAGLAIPGGLFIGLGMGFLLGNLPAWLFIGLGAGFVVMALLKLLGK